MFAYKLTNGELTLMQELFPDYYNKQIERAEFLRNNLSVLLSAIRPDHTEPSTIINKIDRVFKELDALDAEIARLEIKYIPKRIKQFKDIKYAMVMSKTTIDHFFITTGKYAELFSIFREYWMGIPECSEAK